MWSAETVLSAGGTAVAAAVAGVVWWSDRREARREQATQVNAWAAVEATAGDRQASERHGVVVANSSAAPVFDLDVKLMTRRLQSPPVPPRAGWDDHPPYLPQRLGLVPPGAYYLAHDEDTSDEKGPGWFGLRSVDTSEGRMVTTYQVHAGEEIEEQQAYLLPVTATDDEPALVLLRFRDSHGRCWMRGPDGRLRRLRSWPGGLDRRTAHHLPGELGLGPEQLRDFAPTASAPLASTRSRPATPTTTGTARLYRQTANLVLPADQHLPLETTAGAGRPVQDPRLSAVTRVEVTGNLGMGLRLRTGDPAKTPEAYCLEGDRNDRPVAQFYYGDPTDRTRSGRTNLRAELLEALDAGTKPTLSDLTPQQLLTGLAAVIAAHEEQRAQHARG